ncbi:MAG TPA: DUF1553 domain-containing protein [Planctomycetaceae bacterium]|nr:DUF1553 domain-containing protein [Planctomycetaceae bacterium]
MPSVFRVHRPARLRATARPADPTARGTRRTSRFLPAVCTTAGLLGTIALAVNLALGADATPGPSEAATGPKVDFAREVQPLIAKRCVRCHGPDQAKGGVRLDSKEGVLAEGESGEHPVVPKDLEASELLRRISSEDQLERMPPEGKPLTKSEIDVIRRWIAQGAEWQEHWGFRKPAHPEAPTVKNQEWVKNPIDAFILARLEAKGLQPNPPAEKAALIRRAYYDLTGLPPTPEEVAQFVADSDPQAYEKLIDKLLESPRYGERWGRHWLDAVRYADTNSFERDGVKPHAWRYRDYVIRSFNADKPYDQFIREQLAGDEAADPTPDELVATGYYRLGLWDDEPADRLLAKFDTLDDIVATTGQVFLGLTVNCARCHDHKIDPIPQKDYYGLVAFFENITPMSYGGPQVERPLFANQADRQRYDDEQKALIEKRNRKQAEVSAVEAEFRTKYEQAHATETAAAADLDDLEYRFYRNHWDSLPDFDNVKPETVAKVPSQRFDISLATRESDFGFVFTGFLKVPADGEYTFTIDSDDGSRLLIDGRKVLEYDGVHGVGAPHSAKVTLSQGRLPIRLEYFQGIGGRGLDVHWSGPGFNDRLLSAGERPQLNFGELIRKEGRRLLGKEAFEKYQKLHRELEDLKRDKPAVDYGLCVSEFGNNPPETHLLQRGNPHVPGEKVEPSFVSIIDASKPVIPAPKQGATTTGRRTVLANWIASPDNRLTARVMANRVWQQHFGRGIVRSTNNFGQLGDPPTHPELLDWLAGEFVRMGWHLKPLHRLIMTSNTYRMSSRGNEQALKVDPANDLFWRFDMRRLSAEELRDSIHAVNGTLNLKMYGPGVYPTISAEVLQGQSAPGSGWGKSSPEEQARRSVYIHVKRSLITPLLADFDFPETDSSCAARFATTQPTQALGMLNGSFLHEQSAEFAKRLRKEAGNDVRAQVTLALQLALSRKPTESEVDRGMKLIDDFQQKHKISADKALEFCCLMVFNLNEFIYLD